MPFDLTSLGTGGLAVAAATAFGYWMKSRTVITLNNVDDRAKFTGNLMSQLEKAFQEIGELKAAVALTSRREISFIRMYSIMTGEIRVINGYLGLLRDDICKEGMEDSQIMSQTKEIIEGFERIRKLLDEEGQYLSRELALDREARQEGPQPKHGAGNTNAASPEGTKGT